MTRIIIEAIPAEQQRLPAYRAPLSGDWFWDAHGNLVIRVTGTDVIDQDDVFLIALHELIEVKLCHKHGVTQGAVDAFDMAFTGEGEPGDHPDAPYRKEHRQAMILEHLMANYLGHTDYGSIE